VTAVGSVRDGFLKRRPKRGDVRIVAGNAAPIPQHTLTGALHVLALLAVKQTGNCLHSIEGRSLHGEGFQKKERFVGAAVLELVRTFWRFLPSLGKYFGP